MRYSRVGAVMKIFVARDRAQGEVGEQASERAQKVFNPADLVIFRDVCQEVETELQAVCRRISGSMGVAFY
jgi:hypothetical protein